MPQVDRNCIVPWQSLLYMYTLHTKCIDQHQFSSFFLCEVANFENSLLIYCCLFCFLYHVFHQYSAQYYYSSVELWCLLFISAALHIHNFSHFQSWFTSMRDDYADFDHTMSDYTSWLPQWEWEQYYWCCTNTVHSQASGVCIRVILLIWWYIHWCTLLTWSLYYLFRIGHVNECPTMHYLEIPYTLGHRYYIMILTEYFWKFKWKVALWECC